MTALSYDGRPPLDPAIERWLAEREADPTADDTTVAGMRRHSRAVTALARSLLRPFDGIAAETRVVLDPVAGPLPAVVRRPLGEGPFPVVVYLHGGGWIAGDLDTHAQHAQRLCATAGCVVVSVDYRLAPEHVFPAAFDDSVAAVQWVVDNAGSLDGDPRGIVVAGDSAGAQLAASVALACRDLALPLAAQLLIAPVIDACGGYRDPLVDGGYPSREQKRTGLGLTMAAMALYADLYRPVADDWRVSPICAGDFAGIAPAIVHTAGHDPLRDEANAYAELLRAAGVPVIHREWPTLNHGYFGLGGVTDAADLAAASAAYDLREVLTPTLTRPSTSRRS